MAQAWWKGDNRTHYPVQPLERSAGRLKAVAKGRMQERKEISVLVIDDDEVFRHLVRIHLTNAGYKVETAEDAIEGGKALIERAPDLIICDINMPHLDGMQLQ